MELAILHLLTSSDVDVAMVTECEMTETVKDFSVAGYTTFFPKVPEGKSKTGGGRKHLFKLKRRNFKDIC
jgi:hypothetical protein